MIEIVVDITDLVHFRDRLARAQMAGFPNGVSQLVLGMEEIRQDWIDYVRGTLGNEPYAQELESVPVIFPYGGDPLQAACIGGKIAGGVENGSKAWDMKPGFLEGQAVHTSGPNGERCGYCGEIHFSKETRRWVNVPFRHGTPGTTGRIGAPMPREIHKAAKKLNPYTGGGVFGPGAKPRGERLKPPGIGAGRDTAEWGQRTQFRIPPGVSTAMHGTTAPNPRSKQGYATYTWKTGLYNEMVRVVRPKGKGVHTQYMTWRRVSDKSPAESWWYPARAARPVRALIVDRNREKLKERVRYGVAIDMGLAPETRGFPWA